MSSPHLPTRNLAYFWRTNVAIVLGVVAGAAALTGALLVGDSMRGSLRAMALERLGLVEYALTGGRFFGQDLGGRIARQLTANHAPPVPLVALSGGMEHARGGTRANRVQLLGVEDRFGSLHAPEFQLPRLEGREVALNEELASKLGASVGDDVLIRVAASSEISSETIMGRRDQAALSARLTVRAIVPSAGPGTFALSPRQQRPMNAFLPLETLQRILGRRGEANALLIPSPARRDGPSPKLDGENAVLSEALRRSVTLEDLGLRLRENDEFGYVALESEAVLLPPAVELAALDAARQAELQAASVLAYLANDISIAVAESSGEQTAVPNSQPADSGLPYSIVAAVDTTRLAAASLPFHESAASTIPATRETRPALHAGEILLNRWAADDLGARTGDLIHVKYYLTSPFGELQTHDAHFTLVGIVDLSGPAADRGLAPEYPGVTDADSVADWDPPFPVDLKRIRSKDEDYWDEHRATPKAFLSLEDGRRLWAERGDRFGRLTSIRTIVPAGESPRDVAERWRAALLEHLDPAQLGLRFEPVRDQALAASSGSTDFGGLFIGFSFFLILSAAMLVALLFRLSIERRAAEIGLLLAIGWSRRRVAGLLLAEGAVIATIGALLGQFAALGYAWLMLAGLRSWWSAAVSAPFLQLFVNPASIAIGLLTSVLVALVAIAWALRGLTKQSPRALLAGTVQSGRTRRGQTARSSLPIAVGAFAVGGALLLASVIGNAIPMIGALWGSGASMLVGLIATLRWRLASEPQGTICTPGPAGWLRLGIRNVGRQRGRSLLTIGLVASATFVVTSLEAFRLEGDSAGKFSGAGGFALIGQADVPLPYDLRTASGRASLNLPAELEPLLARTAIFPFRLRPGDEASCLNLYRPQQPRVLGAPAAFIERGGFAFAGSLVTTDAERANPWRLLQATLADGAIPVIGDEAAVLWQLHSGVGKDFEISDDRGEPIRLRFVALLRGSILQSELIVSEENFNRIAPAINGYAFYLVEAPAGEAAAVGRTLESGLGPFSFEATRATERLRQYFAVQNTYLSTFQTLGGLGMVLGVIGLAAVLLRNVWERRGELALMRAVGFSSWSLGWIVLVENAALVLLGLLAGLVPAMVAIAPHIVDRAQSIPWLSLAAILLGVATTGLLAGLFALASALRAPLLPALRSE